MWQGSRPHISRNNDINITTGPGADSSHLFFFFISTTDRAAGFRSIFPSKWSDTGISYKQVWQIFFYWESDAIRYVTVIYSIKLLTVRISHDFTLLSAQISAADCQKKTELPFCSFSFCRVPVRFLLFYTLSNNNFDQLILNLCK